MSNSNNELIIAFIVLGISGLLIGAIGLLLLSPNVTLEGFSLEQELIMTTTGLTMFLSWTSAGILLLMTEAIRKRRGERFPGTIE